jgi:hypothetical protein
MSPRNLFTLAGCFLFIAFGIPEVGGAETRPGRTPLPQSHEYQVALRDCLATLKEADFDHGVSGPLTVAEEELDAEEQYRLFVMTMMHQPLVGWKRGIPAVNAPSRLFLLSSLEGPLAPETPAAASPPVAKPPPATTTADGKPLTKADVTPVPIPEPTGIVVPPVWPETLVAFTEWNYPGNPYYDNRGLKLRAFVTAAVKLIMLDDYFDQNPAAGRADWNAYQLVTVSEGYRGAKELLPADVRKAYETGLMKLARRMLDWGVKGEEPNKDLSVPISLWYVARVCRDSAFAAEVEAYARPLFTDPRRFHPAGYWVERGDGIDVGFGGGANFYAVWAALATDWPFARETVERAYRLRNHLTLPEPDGFTTGPSHFNRRIGSPTSSDQWHWDGARDQAAAMITDEAWPFIKRPTDELLSGAAANRVAWFNFQIKQNLVRPDTEGRKSALRTGYWANDEIRGSSWTWRLWQTYNFPIGVNPGFAFYKSGSYARLKSLEDGDSPLLKSPYLRDENFVRNFGDAFISAKQPSYAAIVHVGPVGAATPDDGLTQMAGPLGFGGGQLSAFWTRATGAVVLGRRIGTTSETNFDAPEKWREWPLHAVTGATKAGEVFTSARHVRPETNLDLATDRGTATAAGSLTAALPGTAAELKGRVAYRRRFTIEPDGVRVETTVEGEGRDEFAELYETLPIYLRDAQRQAKAAPTVIEFQVGDAWTPATDAFQFGVTAVRLTRFDGAVTIAFDEPQRMKLSPAEWADTYLTRANCRNILIDLTGDKSARVGYRIAAVAKP